MNKYCRILSTIILAVLILLCLTVMISNASAKEVPTTSAALTVTNQVAGLDLSKYETAQTIDVNGPNLGNLPTENMRYALDGNGSHIEMLYTYANGSLEMIDVLENVGAPHMTTSPSPVTSMAQRFLTNYQGYSGNQLYGQLASMIKNVDVTKNSTTINGSVKFDVTPIFGQSPVGNTLTLTWSYTANEINATGKCVSLSYKNGFLKDFIDTWNLYNVGSTSVNLSLQQAETIAMKNAQTYSYSIGSGNETIVINRMNITKPMDEQLVFLQAGNASNSRNSNPLTLYPAWRIGVGLDKYYPGNVYGIYVDIWADTGQIRDIKEVFSTLPPPDNDTATIADCSIPSASTSPVAMITTKSSSSLTWLLVGTFAAFSTGVVPIYLFRKRAAFHSLNLPKVRKVIALVLSLVMISATLATIASAVPTASGAVANIWGNSSAGSPYLYHTSTEISAQQSISTYVTSQFQSAGYAANNYEQNSQTIKSNILSYTQSDGQLYPSVETVYFDHGIGLTGSISSPYQNEWHYMVCTDHSILNQPSDNVFDWMISGATSSQNNYFTYISTCLSAALHDGSYFGATGTYGSNSGGSGYIIGMPYAWTHKLTTSSPNPNPPTGYMSEDGYWQPDSGKFCYIGFDPGSAALCQSVDNRQGGSSTYYDFVYAFFYYALSTHVTVNQALDAAAYMCFTPETFAGTALYQGFTAYWPGCNPPTGPGQMHIYGNGNIYIYPGCPDYITTPSISGNAPNPAWINNEYQFSASATDPYGYYVTYTFNWGDGSSPTVTNYPYGVSHTWASPGAYTITVTAQSQNGISSNAGYYTIYVYDPNNPYNSIAVNAYDGYGFPLNPNIYVDGNYAGTAPATVQVAYGSSLSVDGSTWDPYLGYYPNLAYVDSDGTTYYNAYYY